MNIIMVLLIDPKLLTSTLFELLDIIITLAESKIIIYNYIPSFSCSDINQKYHPFIKYCLCHRPHPFFNKLTFNDYDFSFHLSDKILDSEFQLLAYISSCYNYKLYIHLHSPINLCKHFDKRFHKYIVACHCYRPDCPTAIREVNLLKKHNPALFSHI